MVWVAAYVGGRSYPGIPPLIPYSNDGELPIDSRRRSDFRTSAKDRFGPSPSIIVLNRRCTALKYVPTYIEQPIFLGTPLVGYSMSMTKNEFGYHLFADLGQQHHIGSNI